MDTKLQTSFIPKKPLMPTTGLRHTKHVSFFSILVILIFIFSILGAGLVFAYQKYLGSRIASMQKSLEAAERSLDANLIGEWVRLDKRVESTKDLLHTHIAFSNFLDLLETMTMRDVYFKNFGYTLTNNGRVAIAMDGEASSFATVALQSDEFAKNSKVMTNQLFSNIDLTQTGNVVFRFTATLDPSVVSYEKLIMGQGAEGAPAELPAAGAGRTEGTTRSLPQVGNQPAATNTRP
jgi:hypothetical protein